MLRSQDFPVPVSTAKDRRLFQIKIALGVVGALFLLSITLFFVRASRAAPAPGAVTVPKEPAPRPLSLMEPLVNEYILGGRYVLQILVPGVYPELEVDLGPVSRKTVLTITGTP